MSKYVPITQGLRDKAVHDPDIISMTKEDFEALCDAIDAVQVRLEEENTSLKELVARVEHKHADMSAFCMRLEMAAKSREDVTLFGVDYMALPVNSDKEAIHIGDTVDWCDGSGDPIEVSGVGRDTLFYVEDGKAEWTTAGNKRHPNDDSWDSILDDMEDLYDESYYEGEEYSRGRDEIIARCKKLAKRGCE